MRLASAKNSSEHSITLAPIAASAKLVSGCKAWGNSKTGACKVAIFLSYRLLKIASMGSTAQNNAYLGFKKHSVCQVGQFFYAAR